MCRRLRRRLWKNLGWSLKKLGEIIILKNDTYEEVHYEKFDKAQRR